MTVILIHETLRIRRVLYGLTQAEVAAQAGITVAHVSRIEAGHCRCDEELWGKLVASIDLAAMIKGVFLPNVAVVAEAMERYD